MPYLIELTFVAREMLDEQTPSPIEAFEGSTHGDATVYVDDVDDATEALAEALERWRDLLISQ